MKITLPLLKPIITFLVVMSIIWGLQMFDEPHVLFNSSMTPIGGPNNIAMTVIMHFYDTAFKGFRLGKGAAIAYGAA
jgi:multiple sugar transport system permease protein/cellobiose transport system permease protein